MIRVETSDQSPSGAAQTIEMPRPTVAPLVVSVGLALTAMGVVAGTLGFVLGFLPLIGPILSQIISQACAAYFAIVIVGGLSATLVMSIFLLPTVYVWIARNSDKLPMPEEGFE